MRYRLTGQLVPVSENEAFSETESLVETLSREEFAQKYPELAENPTLARAMEHARFCKAEPLADCVAGTLLVPSKENLLKSGVSMAFYLDSRLLLLVDDSGAAENTVHAMDSLQVPGSGVARFFFEFLEVLVREDAAYLQKLEKHLDSLEEKVLESEVKNFDNKLHTYRRGLLKLNSYYSQLIDLADTLSDNLNGLFCKADCRAFDLLSARISRLSGHTRALREYSLQLHEIYQSKLDARQNKVMQFLTVVTAIFMPLTLIAGWYGMNFTGMPELRAPYAYPIVIAVSALVIVVEIIYFKRKKWL